MHMQKSYEKAIRKNPNDASVYASLGWIYLELGRFRIAKKTLLKAIRLEPDSITYCNLASALIELNEIKASIQACRQALRLDPNYRSAYLILGNNYLILHRYQKAIVFFRKALHIRPSLPIPFQKEIVYVNMGFAYDKKGMGKKAFQAYKNALEINPKYSLAHANIGAAYLDFKKYYLAIKHSRLALLQNPNGSLARSTIALAYQAVGENKYFLRHYRILKCKDPAMAKKCLEKMLNMKE